MRGMDEMVWQAGLRWPVGGSPAIQAAALVAQRPSVLRECWADSRSVWRNDSGLLAGCSLSGAVFDVGEVFPDVGHHERFSVPVGVEE